MKKKILIFLCKGGGGHITASQAIKSYLTEQDYEVVTVDILGDLFAHLDPFYYLTLKKYTGQDLYNFLLSNNLKRLVNLIPYLGYFLLALRKNVLRKALIHCIKKEEAAVIISVIPLFNKMLLDISEELQIPYLLVPTDLDTRLYNVAPPYHDKAVFGLGFDLPDIREQFDIVQVPRTKTRIIGFPIRPSFFEPKNKNELKKKFNVPLDKPVIMLVMGATGSSATESFLKVLQEIKNPFHIIPCIGRSFHLRTTISKLKLPEHISCTIIDINSDISDIMAISDLCITKPGPVTFAETLYMNLPTILDNTSTTLHWERFNLSFVKKYKLGHTIKNYDELKKLVAQFLDCPQLSADMKQNIQQLKKENFKVEFIRLINEMVINT